MSSDGLYGVTICLGTWLYLWLKEKMAMNTLRLHRQTFNLPIASLMETRGMPRRRSKRRPIQHGRCAWGRFAGPKSFLGTVCVCCSCAHNLEWMNLGSRMTANCFPDTPLYCLGWTGQFCPSSIHLSNTPSYLVYLAQWLCHFADTTDALSSLQWFRLSFSIAPVSCRAASNEFRRILAAWTDRVASISASARNIPWDSIPVARDAAENWFIYVYMKIARDNNSIIFSNVFKKKKDLIEWNIPDNVARLLLRGFDGQSVLPKVENRMRTSPTSIPRRPIRPTRWWIAESWCIPERTCSQDKW